MTATGDVGGRSRDGAEEVSRAGSEARGSDETAGNEGHECPFCGSTDTERESAFGSEVSAQQFYCHGCHTVFERIKYDGASADTGRRPE